MEKAISVTLLLFAIFTAAAQKKQIDTARMTLNKAKTDTEKYIALHSIGVLYQQNQPDSALTFEQQAFLLAKKTTGQLTRHLASTLLQMTISLWGIMLKVPKTILGR